MQACVDIKYVMQSMLMIQTLLCFACGPNGLYKWGQFAMYFYRVTFNFCLWLLKTDHADMVRAEPDPSKVWEPWIWFSMMISSYQCRNSHYKDKTVSRLSHLYNGNPCNRKMSLHWISSLTIHLNPARGNKTEQNKINWVFMYGRDHFVNASSQSETMLPCNIVSHWLGAYTKWPLCMGHTLFQCRLSYL